MSCYIRYVTTDRRAVDLQELEQALKAVDPAFVIQGDLIRHGEDDCGIVDITTRGHPVCDGDLELLERLAAPKRQRLQILSLLRQATGMVCVQPLAGPKGNETDLLAPLWAWLLENRGGLLVWEGGHFSDQTGDLP
jgi:hypothetical protein